MDITSLPVIAGIASTAIFAGSVLPMLAKALRTRELSSYSLGNLVMANVGNAVHSVYVFSLPPGPLWILHSFNQSSTALMLVWFLRYELLPRRRRARSDTVDLEGDLLDVPAHGDRYRVAARIGRELGLVMAGSDPGLGGGE